MISLNPVAPTSRSSDEALLSSHGVSAIHRLLDREVSLAELEENTAWVGQSAANLTRKLTRLLLLTLGGELLALPASAVIRVVLPCPVARVPHRSNDVFRGMVSVDGELVLVANLARLLGMPSLAAPPNSDAARRSRLVVFGPANDAWAFLADEVRGVDAFDDATFRDPPLTVEQSATHAAAALVPVGEGSEAACATLLDVSTLLSQLRRRLS